MRLPQLDITFPFPGEVRISLGDHLLGGGDTVARAFASVDPQVLNRIVEAMMSRAAANDTTDNGPDDPCDAGDLGDLGDLGDAAPTDDELSRDPEWQEFCDGRAPTDADVEGLWVQMCGADDLGLVA